MDVVYYSVYTNFAWSLVILIVANPLLLSPLGCRMLLNMKAAGERGANAGTTASLSTVSSMGFRGGKKWNTMRTTYGSEAYEL